MLPKGARPQRTRVEGRRRRRRRIVGGVASLVVLAVAMAVGYLVHLDRTVSGNVRHAALLPPEDAGSRQPPGEAAGGRKPLNLLFVGTDERPGEDRARSDVIVLTHLDADRRKIHLIHFPRDLYVTIPGRTGRDRINAAYRYGGMPLLASTIRTLTGVRVDHAAHTDFERFVAMTDAVGGVDVRVEEPTQGFRGDHMHVDGAAALAFVRERKNLSQGDISRGRRQQAFITALMIKALSRQTLGNPARLARFVDAATTNLTVDDDLSIEDLRGEALALRGVRGDDVTFITAPMGRFFSTSGGAMVIEPDHAGMKRLGDAIRADALASYRP